MRDQAYLLREMMKEKRKQSSYRAVWGGEAVPSISIQKLKQGCIKVGEGDTSFSYGWATGSEEAKEKFVSALEEAERAGNVLLSMKGYSAIALNLFRLSDEQYCIVRPTISSLEETAMWIKLADCKDVGVAVIIPKEMVEPYGLGEVAAKFLAERSGRSVYWIGSVWEETGEEIEWNDAYSKRKKMKMENENNRTPLVQTVRHHLFAR